MKTISSADVKYKKPPLNDYLGLYNDKLAGILVNNFSLKYLSSATINRLEGQTKFYEYLQKYIQICELLDNNNELHVQVSEEDQILYRILKAKYSNRISGHGNKYFIKLKTMFLPRLLYLFSINLVCSVISKLKPIHEKEYDYIIRTYFDYRSIDTNKQLKDQYFGDLIHDLKRSGKLLIVYRVLRSRDYFDFIRMKSDGFDSVALDYFLNIFSITKAFISFLESHIILDEKFEYDSHDCAELLQLFLDEDYLTLRGLGVFIEKEIAVKLLQLNPKNILFPYENQTWEKVYPFTKELLHHSAKITGYQHTGVSYKILNYFPSKVERHLPVFPDKIVTVGNIINKLLSEKANYPSEIAVGGALRFNKHFINDGTIEINSPTRVIYKKIVYAFSYDKTKYEKIISTLTEVFGNTEINVLLKFHPDYVEEDILKSIRNPLPSNFITSGSINWNQIFRTVDFVLYDDNSIAFEGMIQGVKTFSLAESEQIYDITRKFDFDIWQENLTKDDLTNIKNQLLSGAFDKEYDKASIHTYINNYFTKYQSDEHLNEFI